MGARLRGPRARPPRSVVEVDRAGRDGSVPVAVGRRRTRWHAGPVFDAQADRGAALTVDHDVGERRYAHEVDASRGDVAARDGDGLDRLIEGTSADNLDLDGTRLANCTRHRACDRI